MVDLPPIQGSGSTQGPQGIPPKLAISIQQFGQLVSAHDQLKEELNEAISKLTQSAKGTHPEVAHLAKHEAPHLADQMNDLQTQMQAFLQQVHHAAGVH